MLRIVCFVLAVVLFGVASCSDSDSGPDRAGRSRTDNRSTSTSGPSAAETSTSGSDAQSDASELEWGVEQTVASGGRLELAFNSTTTAVRLNDGVVVVGFVADGVTTTARRTADGNWNVTALPTLAGARSGNKPAVVKLADGSILVAWSVGSAEGPLQVVWSRSVDGGVTWTEAAEVAIASPADAPVALSSTPDGAVLAVAADDGSVRAAHFDGRGWGESVTVADAGTESHDVSIGGCGDDLLMAWEAAATEGAGKTVLQLARSTDGGSTFAAPSTPTIGSEGSAGGDPSVACEAGTFILGLQNRGSIWVASSTDIETWTPVYGPQPGLFVHVQADAGIWAACWELFEGDLRDDTGKTIGLAVGGPGFDDVGGPYAQPTDTQRTGQIRASVVVEDGNVDLYWVDTTTDPATLRYQSATGDK